MFGSAALVVGVVAIVPGCGGSSGGDAGSSSSNVKREASASPIYDTSCPEKSDSQAIGGIVFNAVPGDRVVTIRVPRRSYDCSDWSGVSTPGRAFDGLEVQSGYPESYRLEGNTGAAAVGGPWTMQVAVPLGGTRGIGASSRFTTNPGGYIGATAWYERADGAESPKTDWDGVSVFYEQIANASMIADTDPEDVKEICSQPNNSRGRAFGLGVYKGNLSWLLCN